MHSVGLLLSVNFGGCLLGNNLVLPNETLACWICLNYSYCLKWWPNTLSGKQNRRDETLETETLCQQPLIVPLLLLSRLIIRPVDVDMESV